MGSNIRVLPDPCGEGVVLELHGAEQSHVNVEEPWNIRHEYARRIANVLDCAWPGLMPLTVVHLGAGALTLPRYVEATRPGSAQIAVDIEPGLFDVIREKVPLPPRARITCVTGDARSELARLSAAGSRFHAIILDVFAGRGASPAHLACESFYREMLAALTADGLLLINVGDDDGLVFLTEQLEQLERAWGHGPLMLSDSRVAVERVAGNAVLVAGPGVTQANGEQLLAALNALGPHPAYVGFPQTP